MEKENKGLPLYFLNDRLEFPSVEHANAEGLLAVGGDLSSERLLLAYRNGIFPWFNNDDLLLYGSFNFKEFTVKPGRMDVMSASNLL